MHNTAQIVGNYIRVPINWRIKPISNADAPSVCLATRRICQSYELGELGGTLLANPPPVREIWSTGPSFSVFSGFSLSTYLHKYHHVLTGFLLIIAEIDNKTIPKISKSNPIDVIISPVVKCPNIISTQKYHYIILLDHPQLISISLSVCVCYCILVADPESSASHRMIGHLPPHPSDARSPVQSLSAPGR